MNWQDIWRLNPITLPGEIGRAIPGAVLDMAGAPRPGALPPPQNFGPGPAWEQSGRGMPPINAAPPLPMPTPPGPAWEQTGRGMPPLPVETMEQTGVDEQGLDAPQDTGKTTDKYSFFDSPGASDSLIAFGASMLKAPDFLTGLADGAMAVNQVAQKYRPFSQREMDKARQLAQMKLMADPEYYRQQQDPNALEVDQGSAYYDENGRLYFPAKQGNQTGWVDSESGQFATGVKGLTRATDSFLGANNRAGGKMEMDAQEKAYLNMTAASENVQIFDQLMGDLPTSGVGMDFYTRSADALTRLTGESFGGIDPSDSATFDARIKAVALNWSQKMAGQGQVTEYERQMIQQITGEKQKLTPQAAQRLFETLRSAEQRKIDLYNNWISNANGVQQAFNGRFTAYQAAMIKQAQQQQSATGGANQGSSTSPSTSSGTTSSGIKWKVN